ncbi:MAG: hypothetical protein IPF59_11375 [Ignavibacteria bacterium]|nr:hypothetical protein [Ignavibacteria bacterium]
MEHITSSILIDAPIEKVFHFHDDTTNLLKITPPGIKVSFETLGEPGLGYEVILKVRQFGLFTMRWHVRVTQYQPPYTHDRHPDQRAFPFMAANTLVARGEWKN